MLFPTVLIFAVYADHMGGGDVPVEETEKEKTHIKKLAAELSESEVPLYQ